MIATDLDRTLIYSHGAIDAYGGGEIPVVPVERYQDADASFMTVSAAKLLAEVQRDALLVPTTTRTPEQYQRITVPGAPPRYAIAANGGILLVDGRIDHDWDSVVAAELAVAAPLAEIWEHAGHVCRPEWTIKLRNACGLFCYAVLDRTRTPATFVAEMTVWADARGWQTSLQGRKLYWVPKSLTKSAAVTEIVRRTGCDRVVAAGDSLLDADLLLAADAGIAARHGELVASGWAAAHVAVTSAVGVLAGEEIVEWFATQSRADAPDSS